MARDVDRDPGPAVDRLVNHLLLGIFLPVVLLFVALWAAFRLVFDELLLSHGLVQITPQPEYGAVAGGWGRFLLLVALTAVLALPYSVLYFRVLRHRLAQRGLV